MRKLLPFVLFGLVGCSLPKAETSEEVYARWDREEQATKAAPPDITLTAEELSIAYDKRVGGSYESGEAKYVGKVLKITGRVEWADTSATPKLYLKCVPSTPGVMCWFKSEDIPALAALKENQEVAVKGRCGGEGGGNVQLEACLLYANN